MPRGWRGWLCSGPLLRASPCPRCRLPWAGCRQAALSRPPSRTLHFSVWCETVAVINNLTGAPRAEDTAQLGSLHQRVGAGAGSPSSPLPPHPRADGSAAQHPRLWSSSKDSACLAGDVSRCLVLGPSLSRHFPRFLPLPCFVCSQSVSFVSVFAKPIRSLPPAAVSLPVPPLYP